MSLTKDFVLNALLKHNFFPVQKKNREELPPVFTSFSFSERAARRLVAALKRSPGIGWDGVEYRATRFNGVPRCLTIPHPLAHANLSLCIYEHWLQLNYTATNKVSLIRPRRHTDGRIIIMDYERALDKSQRHAQLEFGKRFKVHTDIANFFPSVYSHAVAWAAVGFAKAKACKGAAFRGEWFNQLDEKLRASKRNETQGVAIGPATSNVVAEAILARVDEVLRSERFEFVRFIDDSLLSG